MTPLRLARTAGIGFCAAMALALTPALADDSLSLVLGGQTPTLMNTLNLVAEGAGFYRDEHLSVSLTLVKDSPEATQACSNGKFDICPIGIEPLITRYEKGERLKLFLSRAAKFTYVYAVLEDSPIRSLADFKGKSIGVHSSTGPTAVGASQSGLTIAGLKATDYTLVTIGKDDEAMAQLVSGKVAGAALPYYEFIPYIVAGRKLRILHHPTLENVTNSGYAISPAVLAAKTDAVKRFSRSIVKSSLLIRYNPKAAARAWLTAQHKPFSAKDLTQKTAELNAWQAYLPAADPTNQRIGAITIAGIQSYIDLMKKSGFLKDPVAATELTTDDLIEAANDFDHEAFERTVKSMQ